MKHTKKKRKEIYLAAAKAFQVPLSKREEMYTNNCIITGFCDYLEKYKLGNVEDFKEYMTFKPKKPLSVYEYWFSTKRQTKRISVLKSCAKMCDC